MAKEEPTIAVTVNGPYRVDGDLPIVPKRMITSELGESLTWASDVEIPHDKPAYLCRCGRSNNKPFCDNSHVKAGFDGSETASTATFSESEKIHIGPGLTVHRVGSLCQHAGFCVNESTEWSRMVPNTGDVNVRTQLIGMIEHCPSGALAYDIDGQPVEPDLETAIAPVEDGPYWVTGGVRITRSDGIEMEVRNRVTLCRCGQSQNKPLCDGTHFDIGFQAKTPAPRVEVSPGGAPDAPAPLATRRVLVVIEDSGSERVLSVAGQIASSTAAHVSLVHVGEGTEAEFLLGSAREAMTAFDVPREGVVSELLTGHPGAAIERHAESYDAGLIIMERGGAGLSKTSHEVAYHSPCDLLLVSDTAEPQPIRKILIATDGSVTADRAAKRGYALARSLAASVDIVFVGHPATGALVVEDTISIYGEGVETRTHLLEGDPIEGILGTATSADCQVIVVGNKGLTSTRNLLGTSVPGRVLEGAQCHVLLSRTVRQMESELEPGEGGVIDRHGEPVAAFVDLSGELHLMSARCPHLGCVVAWDPADGNFECPCHGSRFSPVGEVIQGPATSPLREL